MSQGGVWRVAAVAVTVKRQGARVKKSDRYEYALKCGFYFNRAGWLRATLPSTRLTLNHLPTLHRLRALFCTYNIFAVFARSLLFCVFGASSFSLFRGNVPSYLSEDSAVAMTPWRVTGLEDGPPSTSPLSFLITGIQINCARAGKARENERISRCSCGKTGGVMTSIHIPDMFKGKTFPKI